MHPNELQEITLLLYYFAVCIWFSGYSQEADSIAVNPKNGIVKPSILSTHPFGLFISRIQGILKHVLLKEQILQ